MELAWVNEDMFQYLCTGVILVNLCAVVVEVWHPAWRDTLWYPDQVFLVFYCVELALKGGLYQKALLIGHIGVVWWNWLDLFIVAAGIIDQWAIPFLEACGVLSEGGSGDNFHANALRSMRVVRMTRLIRVLKIVRIFLRTDLSWTGEPPFQGFITGVVVLNAIAIGLEVDHHWDIWVWLEQIILLIYFFELSVRVKRWGCVFFVHPEDWAWNNLDFGIVAAGVFEMWMLPTMKMFEAAITGQPPSHESSSASLLPLLRMMRLLRILRLVRVLKSVRPLYKLAVGVLEAMQSMQWVLVFTIMILYASGILFRSLMCNGILISSAQANREALTLFSSVPQSMFHLFRLMNGLSPVQCLLSTSSIRMLYMLFMVLSNWAMLAILTGVVSDNMIIATQESARIDAATEREEVKTRSRMQLQDVFVTLDKDRNGKLSAGEFKMLMNSEDLRDALCEASGLTARDLSDLFEFFSNPGANGESFIDYHNFIEKLQCESKDVSERSVFRVEKQLTVLEHTLDQKLDEFCEELENRRLLPRRPSAAIAKWPSFASIGE
eukprot:NODE_3790_length_1985_cov_12.503229.p1 GENE.NODE_3790_length_1985_cov_12.503229~~NODE_3790_length_1985_cov_12.503229.p1  ORF type:complete len:577 (-),score=150.81 NODE_3790_length_1985_cov_12.503229:253-1902(-)